MATPSRSASLPDRLPDNMSGMLSSKESPARRRVKVGATLDPELLGAVDAYVARHPDTDRSAVLDDALRLWQEREQDLAMERQIREDAQYHDDPDRVAWRELRDAAAARTFTKRR
jgi:Arc/MetJ-type ribon-helix-helix transcriptional regulator